MDIVPHDVVVYNNARDAYRATCAASEQAYRDYDAVVDAEYCHNQTRNQDRVNDAYARYLRAEELRTRAYACMGEAFQSITQ